MHIYTRLIIQFIILGIQVYLSNYLNLGLKKIVALFYFFYKKNYNRKKKKERITGPDLLVQAPSKILASPLVFFQKKP